MILTFLLILVASCSCSASIGEIYYPCDVLLNIFKHTIMLDVSMILIIPRVCQSWNNLIINVDVINCDNLSLFRDWTQNPKIASLIIDPNVGVFSRMPSKARFLWACSMLRDTMYGSVFRHILGFLLTFDVELKVYELAKIAHFLHCLFHSKERLQLLQMNPKSAVGKALVKEILLCPYPIRMILPLTTTVNDNLNNIQKPGRNDSYDLFWEYLAKVIQIIPRSNGKTSDDLQEDINLL